MKNKIVLVPFPFDDLSSYKVRPAICLTSEIGKYNHIVVAFISSNVKNSDEEFDILLEKGNELFLETGLITDSVIKLHRMVTIPIWLVKRKLGNANPKLTEAINTNLKKIFEIENN